ncbi:phytanoyl-CoA dioxygenase [Pyxidicoccus fallax]|uniref:Phytanoyl-CoA dioxygenase family protein n=1 Tax=Pyxidicoccus fallax TaxID=394095 RepID=A0A848LH84_9BACT|nr:phytanoyl-CoA dioxygenase family protein [Pyxidicoccus fallax]NMO16351.1 phytanoyl-CoA dioxygenase family protein [Pyxidicoccus fallax]NPC85828.1 phytanoyl-CoA dioxygenase [Pyxidicoccus fallax]
MIRSFLQALHDDGFALAQGAASEELLHTLETSLRDLPSEEDSKRRGGQRNVLDSPATVAAISRATPLRALAQAVLGPDCFVARALLFDKTAEANWKVRWHQDLTIAVQERRDVPGFGPWTHKDGVTHTHAPTSLLARMVSLRIHLDDCGEENGPLRVLPGSHRVGRISEAELDAWKDRVPSVTCLARRGDVLAFHPLLLHASSPATRPGHRRVLHLELAADPLPDGLEWRWRL